MENKLVARIEHTYQGNIINCFDNCVNYKQFEGLKSKCELCGTIRYRKYSYIVKMADTGKLIQVGSNCLNKVIGDMDEVENAIYKGTKVSYDSDREFFTIKGSTYYFPKTVVLAYIVTNAEPDTLEVFEWWAKHKYEITDEHKAICDKVFEYYKNLEPNNSFLSNLKIAMSLELIKGNVKLLSYAYQNYLDHLHYIDINNGQGLTNDTFTINKIWIERKYCNTEYSYYGTDQIIYRMLDENNNIIEFDTASEKDFLTWLGKKVKCVIKKQYKSRLGLVTKVTRLKEAR